jgi:ribosomal protein S18 acetylase RimI-like enzyme
LIRPATSADAQAILAVANQHELSVDPDFEAYPLSEIEEQIQGFVEPGHPFVYEADGIKAAVLIQSYSPRQRVEVDLFTIGTKEQTSEIFSFALSYMAEKFPGFKIRTACNQIDTELLEIFEESGLKFYRDYFKLKKPSITKGFPALPAGVEIKAVAVEEHGELLHRLETSSFSGHFGYFPISSEDWIRERLAENSADPFGSFVAFVDAVPAGFLLSSDSRADIQGGWVDKLGVLDEFRGRGLGKLLLKWGIAHAAQKGYTSIGLGADTGNESGALELYFGLGFEKQLSWRAYSS